MDQILPDCEFHCHETFASEWVARRQWLAMASRTGHSFVDQVLLTGTGIGATGQIGCMVEGEAWADLCGRVDDMLPFPILHALGKLAPGSDAKASIGASVPANFTDAYITWVHYMVKEVVRMHCSFWKWGAKLPWSMKRVSQWGNGGN